MCLPLAAAGTCSSVGPSILQEYLHVLAADDPALLARLDEREGTVFHPLVDPGAAHPEEVSHLVRRVDCLRMRALERERDPREIVSKEDREIWDRLFGSPLGTAA